MYLQGIDTPLETYFWPAELVCVEEEEGEEEGEEVEEEKQHENTAEEDESVDVSGLLKFHCNCIPMCVHYIVLSCVQLSTQLETLTEYLRTEHFYCVWCGTTYDGNCSTILLVILDCPYCLYSIALSLCVDMSDLAQHCPGDTAEAHED